MFNRKKAEKTEPGIVYDLRQDIQNHSVKIAKEEFTLVESVRQEKLKSYEFRLKVAAVLVPVVTPFLGWLDWLLITMQQNSDDGFAGLTILFITAVWGWVNAPKRQYKKTYKRIFMPRIVQAFGNFKYDIKGRISSYLMSPSKILPAHDRYKSEDYFEGHYKDTTIRFSEIDLAVRRRSKRRTYYDTVFKGLAVLFENPDRKFFGHTIIEQDASSLTEWFKEKSSGLKRANLVDPEFEGVFDVYTNDQVEARYLIHPVTIEKLNDLARHYQGKNLTAAFYDDKFLILIRSNKNHFEPPDIKIPATSPDSLYRLKEEIEDILSIGDQLELYDREKVQNA